MRLLLRRYGKTILILVLVLAVSTGVALWLGRFFDVQNIEVVGPTVSLSVDQKKLDKNILFFPSEKVRAQILLDNPMLKDVQIHKKLPHTLVIVAYPRSPIARLATGDHEVLIDENGFAVGLASVSDGTLPLLSFSLEGIPIGRKNTDPRVSSSLAFIKGIGDIKVTSIQELDSASLTARIAETDIYFTQGEDVASKVNTLQTIIAGFRIKGTLPKVIDLRFDKPIVRF